VIVTSGWEQALAEHMRKRDAHVLLSGMGGDEMFYPSNLPLPGLGDMWRSGRLSELHQELLRWSHAVKEPYIHLLVQSFREGLLGGRWGVIGTQRWAPPAWMHPRLTRHSKAARLRYVRQLRPYRMPSKRDHAAGYYNATGIIARGARQEFDAWLVTYPCLHRPLVEFMHAVPFGQKLRCGESRSLQRRALRSVLPLSVLERRGKVSFDEPVIRSLREDSVEWQALLTGSHAEALGYIDAEEASRPLSRLRAGLSGASARPAHSVFVLETWLRSRATGRQSTLATTIAE
jgi:asparagine synthetase B (glutamine-hydrolysing)